MMQASGPTFRWNIVWKNALSWQWWDEWFSAKCSVNIQSLWFSGNQWVSSSSCSSSPQAEWASAPMCLQSNISLITLAFLKRTNMRSVPLTLSRGRCWDRRQILSSNMCACVESLEWHMFMFKNSSQETNMTVIDFYIFLKTKKCFNRLLVNHLHV